MSIKTLINNDLASNSFHIKYFPKIKVALGCERATIILGRLEYWFGIPKFAKGFYKFVEPCQHPLYQTGDSWVEELGFSRKIFSKAFDIIGVRYKSKSAFKYAEDKFQGKLYASYHDRKSNKTFFVRNHDFASDFIQGLFKKKPEVKSPPQPKVQKEVEEPRVFSSQKSRSSNGQNRRSSWGTIGGKESLSSIQRNTPSFSDQNVKTEVRFESLKEEETEEMIKIWIEEVGDAGGSINPKSLVSRLKRTLENAFNGSLEEWRAYCSMISSSKFLMGEGSNKFFKKAWLSWAIDEANIDKIREGAFSLGDRQTNHDKKIEAVDREIRSVEHKKHQVEMQIANIKSDERDKRRNIVKERIKNLSNEERQSLEQDFEDHLKRENNSMTEEFRKFKWNGMFISAYFDSFVEEKIYAELFKKEDEDNDEKVVQASELLELLNDVCHDLDQVKQKKMRLELRGVTLDSQNFRSSTQKPLIDPNFDPQVFNPLEKAQNMLVFSPQRSLS